MNEATVRLSFGSPAEAEAARTALEPDNGGHLDANVDANTLELRCTSDSIMGILRTLDDALGCLRATGMD